MDKKFYQMPEIEVVEMELEGTLLDGSAGDGINEDFSAPSDNTPDPEQPIGW